VAVNNPPTCSLYYSVESDGIVVVNGNVVVAGVSPGTATNPTSLTVSLPAGNYYLIAVCSDPDGDLVTATINGITVGPLSEVTAGALVRITEGTSESVDVLVTYDDGTNFLAAQVTINLEGDSGGGGGLLPGFSSVLGITALLGAAVGLRRRQ